MNVKIPKTNAKNKGDYNKYFEFCKKSGKPFCLILEHDKNVTVQYDMISCNNDLSDEAVKKLSEIFVSYFKRYVEPFHKKDYLLCPTKTCGYLNKVRLEDADTIAKKVADIVCNPMNLIPIL